MPRAVDEANDVADLEALHARVVRRRVAERRDGTGDAESRRRRRSLPASDRRAPPRVLVIFGAHDPAARLERVEHVLSLGDENAAQNHLAVRRQRSGE